MSRRRHLVTLLSAAAVCLWPSLSRACAVCSALNERSRLAFFWGTMFLTFLPLALFALGVLWLRHSARAFIASEFEERDAVVVAGSRAGE